MNRRAIGCRSVGLLLVWLAVSCAADKPHTQAGQQVAAIGAAPQSRAVASDSDMPLPPKDAQYTIYCQVIAGPDHDVRSRQLRQALRQATPLKDWYLVHGNGQSTLYYGFYRTVDPRDLKDSKEGKRAIGDLNTIRAMIDTNGFRPFSASVPVPIDAPDPASNLAWDLSRTGAYWTVEIGVYKDSPERKQAAVDAVRAAREQGIEAYYFHGQTVSSVCIGAWPREAVQEIDSAAQNNDPNMPLVVTPQPMAADVAAGFARQGMKAVAPTVDIVDPTVSDVLQRFSEHAVNGDVHVRQVSDPVTGQTKMERERSMLVKVQRREVTPDMTPSMYGGGGAPAATMRETPRPQPGVGRLKSIGE